WTRRYRPEGQGGTMREFEAVRIIETLRSGVSSRHLSAIFSYGREALLEAVQRDLEAVAGGEVCRALVLRGDYGEGKTHFLNTVFNLAQDRNFAVSLVVLGKETPFNRLDLVYPKLTAETYLPGAVEPGPEALLRDLRPESVLARDLLEFARRELHPKIACVLENYWQAADSYHAHLLYGDLAGEWLPLAQLKSLHRLNFGRAVRLPRFTAREYVWDYLRFLAHLIRARGLGGWVILFAVFELVGTLGIAARGEAYCNLARFLFPEEGRALASTYVVFSVASGFWPGRLIAERRPDIEEVPARLLAKGEPRKAELARRAMNALLQHSVTLETLPAGEVRRLLAAVRDRHARAYGWEPEVDLDALFEATKHARLRTKIRYALEYLDLKYLYREEPVVRAGEPEELALEEVAAGEEEAEVPEGHADKKYW
ncbi:MAG: BREX system ATP-binding domain-containing protein, partial [Bacillota bacterium]